MYLSLCGKASALDNPRLRTLAILMQIALDYMAVQCKERGGSQRCFALFAIHRFVATFYIELPAGQTPENWSRHALECKGSRQLALCSNWKLTSENSAIFLVSHRTPNLFYYACDNCQCAPKYLAAMKGNRSLQN
jgi:hypothetical protein